MFDVARRLALVPGGERGLRLPRRLVVRLSGGGHARVVVAATHVHKEVVEGCVWLGGEGRGVGGGGCSAA